MTVSYGMHCTVVTSTVMTWSNDLYNFILTDLQLTTTLTGSISYRSNGVGADPSGRAV